jgi:hypothetical protein
MSSATEADSPGGSSKSSKGRKVLLIIALVILCPLACAISPFLYNPILNLLQERDEPTPTPQLAEQPSPTATLAALTVYDPIPTPRPWPTHTPTPTFTATLTLTPTNTPSPSILQPEPGVSPANGTPAGTASAATEGVVVNGGPISGNIIPVELADHISLPANVERVEFKWIWKDRGCEAPPDGQGFEIRIWPERPGYGPMGIMDAADQSVIACDEKTGARIYEMGDLRAAPGVNAVDGGRFRWEVALVQLDPYEALDVSPSRIFDLPSALPPPSPTPTPRRVSSTEGIITPVEPLHNYLFPAETKKVEFRWRWSQAPNCELPPADYGFELRIWPEQPDFQPLGAMGNAREKQAEIFCDPMSGLFSYTVPHIWLTPAALQTKATRFYWDVTLIQLEPYKPVNSSEKRIIELTPE